MHNKSLSAALALFAFIVAGAFAAPVGTTLSDIVFVDPKTGSDSNPGSITYPCKTVAHVMATHSANEYLEIVLGSRPGTIHVARTNLVLSGVNGMDVPELYIDNMSARVVIDGLSVGALRPPVEPGSSVDRPIVLLLHGAEIRSIPDTRAIVSIYSDSSVKLYENHPNVISRPLIDSDSIAFSGSWWWGTNNTTLHDAFGQMALMFPQGEEDGQVLVWNSELNKWEWRGVLADYWKAADGKNWVIECHYVTQSELSDTYSTKEWVTSWFDANMATKSQLDDYIKVSEANAAFAKKEDLNGYLERAYSNEVSNATNDIISKIGTVAADLVTASNDFTDALYIVSNKVFDTHNPFVDAATDTSQHLGEETTIVDTDKAEFTGSVYISDLKTDKADVESELSAGSITLDGEEISSWSDLTDDIDDSIEGLGDVVTNNYNTFTNLFTNLIERADGVDSRLNGIDEKLEGYDQTAIDSVGGLSEGLQEVSNTLSDVNRDLGAATDTLEWLVPSVGDISNRVVDLETATGTLHEAVTEIKGTVDAQAYTSGWFQVRALAVGTNAISDEASAFSGAFVHGISNTVSADNAYAAGFKTRATEEGAHSEGYESEAGGKYSFAGGYQSKTYGDYSYAYGSNSIANNDYSIALGLRAWAEHNNSFIWSAVEEAAQRTVADGSFVVQPSGGATNFWVGSENLEDIIQRVSGGSGGGGSGGDDPSADPSVSGDYLELTGGTLSGPLVIGAEVVGTTPGAYSFAQGTRVSAEGDYSMASGNGASAIGRSAHAFGEGVRAEGGYSIAAGYNTVASNAGSFALGTYVSTTDNFAFVWSGTSYTSGSYPYRSHGTGTFSIDPRGDLEGFWIGPRSLASILGDYLNTTELNNYSNYVADTFATKDYVDDKVGEISAFDPAVLDGYLKTSGGTVSGDLELQAALKAKGHADFTGSTFKQGISNYVAGGWSHAEGFTNVILGANSEYSHAEGVSNLIYEAAGSHVEGWNNAVSSSYTHVSGVYAGSAAAASNSFVWSGVPSGWYSGLKPGSFNINPLGGIENMWIGTRNLHDHVVDIIREEGAGGGGEIIVNSQPAGVRISNVAVGDTDYPLSALTGGGNWTYSSISNQSSYILLGYTPDYLMFHHASFSPNDILTLTTSAKTYGSFDKTLKIQISVDQNTWVDNEKDLTINIPKTTDYNNYSMSITNYTDSSSVYIRFSCPDAAAAEIPDADEGESGRGISSIDKTATEGLVDTYTIRYTDGTTSTFTVTNGRGISSIDKTATEGLVDTYTIRYTDGTTSTFTVTNGKDGSDGDDSGGGEPVTPTTASYYLKYLPDDGSSYPKPVITFHFKVDDARSGTLHIYAYSQREMLLPIATFSQTLSTPLSSGQAITVANWDSGTYIHQGPNYFMAFIDENNNSQWDKGELLGFPDNMPNPENIQWGTADINIALTQNVVGRPRASWANATIGDTEKAWLIYKNGNTVQFEMEFVSGVACRRKFTHEYDDVLRDYDDPIPLGIYTWTLWAGTTSSGTARKLEEEGTDDFREVSTSDDLVKPVIQSPIGNITQTKTSLRMTLDPDITDLRITVSNTATHEVVLDKTIRAPYVDQNNGNLAEIDFPWLLGWDKLENGVTYALAVSEINNYPASKESDWETFTIALDVPMISGKVDYYGPLESSERRIVVEAFGSPGFDQKPIARTLAAADGTYQLKGLPLGEAYVRAFLDTDNDDELDSNEFRTILKNTTSPYAINYLAKCINVLAPATYSDNNMVLYPAASVDTANPATVVTDSTDNDSDGLPDEWETTYGLSPSDSGLCTKGQPSDIDGDGISEYPYDPSLFINGPYGDPDNDGLSNYAEFLAGTNPTIQDTDGDGVDDYNSSATSGGETFGYRFMDNDGIPDSWESLFPSGCSYLTYDSNLDPDNDGWDNFSEYLGGIYVIQTANASSSGTGDSRGSSTSSGSYLAPSGPAWSIGDAGAEFNTVTVQKLVIGGVGITNWEQLVEMVINYAGGQNPFNPDNPAPATMPLATPSP